MRKILATLILASLMLVGAIPASATSTGRIAGSDRYATAVAISQSAWNSSNTQRIYLVQGGVLADALASGTLTGGPILLTRANRLPNEVDAEISRLGNKPIVVIGGTGVVSDAVARQASRGQGYTRLAGADRHATSVAVSRYGFTSADRVYVTESIGVDGQGSADAVAGGALTGGPILLVNSRKGPTSEVLAEIERLGATKIISLGRTDVKMKVSSVLGGIDRYESSTAIATAAFPGPSKVYLSSGLAFADAVSAGSLTDGPLVLTRPTKLPPAVCTYLRTAAPSQVVALGGPGAVSDKVLGDARRCAEGGDLEPDPAPAPAPETPPASQLRAGFNPPPVNVSKQHLTGLATADPAPMAGYSREQFPHWLDASTWGWPIEPSNACQVRGAALYRDGHGVKVNVKNCSILSGTWIDPFGGATYSNASDMDIDHIVPLAEAWRSGAATWDETRRRTFANDPLVVLSVEKGLNRQKGDRDPAGWKPPHRDSWCNYAKRWVDIKRTYALSADAAEKRELGVMLDTCTQ